MNTHLDHAFLLIDNGKVKGSFPFKMARLVGLAPPILVWCVDQRLTECVNLNGMEYFPQKSGIVAEVKVHPSVAE